MITDNYMYVCMYGCMDGWRDGGMEGWRDVYVHITVYIRISYEKTSVSPGHITVERTTMMRDV